MAALVSGVCAVLAQPVQAQTLNAIVGVTASAHSIEWQRVWSGSLGAEAYLGFYNATYHPYFQLGIGTDWHPGSASSLPFWDVVIEPQLVVFEMLWLGYRSGLRFNQGQVNYIGGLSVVLDAWGAALNLDTGEFFVGGMFVNGPRQAYLGVSFLFRMMFEFPVVAGNFGDVYFGVMISWRSADYGSHNEDLKSKA